MGRLSVIIVIAAALLSACTRTSTRVSGVLARAEACLDSAPGAALAILDSLSLGVIADPALKARYALLKSQALDKNYIDVTSDSLAGVAVDYYRNSGDSRNALMAHYYMGRVKENAADYGGALYHQMRSLKLARELRDTFRIAMSARSIADLYSVTYNSKEAQQYAKIAYDMFKKSQSNRRYAAYAYTDLLRSLHNDGQHDRILPYFPALLQSAVEANDSGLIKTVKVLWGKALIGAGKGKDAVGLFEDIDDGHNASRPYIGFRALSYLDAGRIDDAERLLSLCGDSVDNIAIFNAQYDLYLRKGMHKQSLRALEKYNRLVNADIKWQKRQNFSGALTQLIDEEDRAHKAQMESERTVWVLAVAVGLFVVLLVVIGMAYRFRIKRMALMSRLQSVDNLAQDFNVLKGKLADAHTAVMQAEFKLVDEYCARAYTVGDDEAAKKKILRELLDRISTQISSPDTQDRMVAWANSHADDVITRFREQVPGLKDEDYAVFLYSVLGFSHGAMSMLIKASDVSSIYNRRKRIRRKVKDSNAADKSEFLKYLGDASTKSDAKSD